MNCDELSPDYATYALGSLDGEELAELRAHLARNCPNCTAGVRDANGMVAMMGGAVKLVDPPKRLRKRVLAMVDPNPRSSRMAWLFALTTALSLFVAVHIWLRHAQSHEEFLAYEKRVNETLALFQDPEATQVTFGKGARGRVIISPKHGVAFSGQNMAALAPGKTYEMWVIPKGGGAPIPSGTFAPSADGTAVHLRPGPIDPAQTAAIAVSIEREGGVASPTKEQIIIVAPVAD